MNEQREKLKQLEREAEAMRAALSDDLSRVKPSEAAVDRAKAAVRHELNEAWMRDQAQPEPAAEALDRARSAMHVELAGNVATHRAGWAKGWTWAGLAAAAALALVAGMYLWNSREPDTNDPIADSAQRKDSELVVNAQPEGEKLEQEILALVTSMEAFSNDGLGVDASSDDGSMEDEIDTVESQLASLPEDLADPMEAVRQLNEIMADIDAMLEDTGARQESAADTVREALG